MNYLQILYGLYLASILILVVAVGISASTLPTLFKVVKERDHLILLRQWLLKKNETIIAVGVIAVIVLTARFYIRNVEIARIFIGSLVFLFSLALLRFSILNRKIIKQEYLK